MGRLWQTLILTDRKALFGFLPIESDFYAVVGIYRDLVEDAKQKDGRGIFIELTLSRVLDAFSELLGFRVKGPKK